MASISPSPLCLCIHPQVVPTSLLLVLLLLASSIVFVDEAASATQQHFLYFFFFRHFVIILLSTTNTPHGSISHHVRTGWRSIQRKIPHAHATNFPRHFRNVPRQVHSSHISHGTKVIFSNPKHFLHLFPIGSRGIGHFLLLIVVVVVVIVTIGIIQQVSLGSLVKSQCRYGGINLVGHGSLFQIRLFQTHASKRRLNRWHDSGNAHGTYTSQ
mmetsp:Transcript_383/g.672  ORF Transcript_383/g.672 Transcript_383/m.672 type:complete len:213 (+) Transcript_383:99-737(+)